MRIVLVAAILASTTPVAVAEISADISTLRWLSGCWSYEGRDPGSGEYWMPPAGGMMIAVSRTVRHGRSTAFEYLRIAQSDGGTLTLTASPSGQATAHFRLIELGATRVVFENPEHDFPQRIIYELTGHDRLLGRIEGSREGESMAIDFPMTKSDCSAFE